MKKKMLSLPLALALCLSLIPAAFAAEGQPAASTNKNKQDYSRWASTVKSYLYENQSGGLTRVEYISNQVVIEDYDSSFNCLSSRTIAPELPIWGGFYAGAEFNFLIFGQQNPSESNDAEVIRVVKYDKNWNRLGQASLKGANTTVPFDAGSLRCDEYGGYLYIRTCHEMYTSSDGLNHQSNLTMAVRQSDMSITDSYYEVMNSSYGYISHSFNQFVLVDQAGKLVALDHGDAYPRGVAFSKYYADAGSGKFRGQQYSSWCASSILIEFAGSIGDNTTGGTIGGLAETTDCYIMAYSYDQNGGRGEGNYPYFHWMDKASGKSWSAQLTQTPGCTNPVLAPTGLNGGYMLWNGKNSDYSVNDTLYYIQYGADGKPGEIKTATGNLSDCQPILYNGKAVWYVTNSSAPTFYTLDASGVTAIPAGSGAAAQPAAPTSPTNSTTPGQTVSFSDVKADDWFKPYVEKAAAAGLVNGVGNGKYDPLANLELSQAMVLAYQIDSKATGRTLPQASGAWYMPYYQYCLTNGIITASQVSQSDLTRKASRFEMVAILDKAVPDGNLKPVKTVDSVPDLAESAPYGATVYKWYRAGILSGDGVGRFNGSSNISRAEVAAILCRLNGL